MDSVLPHMVPSDDNNNNDGDDKDDENSDEKDDANDAQATSEGCEDSYLEVARPRRSHHHWENRLDYMLTKTGLKTLPSMIIKTFHGALPNL